MYACEHCGADVQSFSDGGSDSETTVEREMFSDVMGELSAINSGEVDIGDEDMDVMQLGGDITIVNPRFIAEVDRHFMFKVTAYDHDVFLSGNKVQLLRINTAHVRFDLNCDTYSSFTTPFILGRFFSSRCCEAHDCTCTEEMQHMNMEHVNRLELEHVVQKEKEAWWKLAYLSDKELYKRQREMKAWVMIELVHLPGIGIEFHNLAHQLEELNAIVCT